MYNTTRLENSLCYSFRGRCDRGRYGSLAYNKP